MICRHSGCGHIGGFCIKDPSPGNRSCLEEPHEIENDSQVEDNSKQSNASTGHQESNQIPSTLSAFNVCGTLKSLYV